MITMDKITVGILTVSDRCANKNAIDRSGPLLVEMINRGIFQNGVVVRTEIVPDVEKEIKEVIMKWCDDEKINVILTTGGTGISPRDVTPEATSPLLTKSIPGITQLILEKSFNFSPMAALSRAVAGVRGKSLIINFPGSEKACKECLEIVSSIIPHAVALVLNIQPKVENDHFNLTHRKIEAVNSSNVNRESLYKAVDVNEAQIIVINSINLITQQQIIDFKEGLHYVLAEDVVAKDSLPAIDVSLFDGYALPTTYFKGISFKVVCNLPPGEKPNSSLIISSEQCVQVSTGGPIPPKTKVVLKLEETRLLSTEVKQICANIDYKEEGAGIRRKGSDFKKGEIILKRSTKLNAAALGVLASAGITSVSVYKKPLVGVISTGDEIVDPREKPPPEKVRDSNLTYMIHLLKEEGFVGLDLGWAPDDPDKLYEILVRGFRAADVVVTTGSMSMGEKDLLKDILVNEFEAEILFGRVFMKPGLPTAFGILEFEGKPKVWFGFAGNPASAAVASHLFLLPALRGITKETKVYPTIVSAVLVDEDIKPLDRPHYVRGILSFEDGKLIVRSTGGQMSSRIGSCVNSNCLILIPCKTSKVGTQGKLYDVVITGKV